MADDTLRLDIQADASGVTTGVRQAEKALDNLGDSVEKETKNLNRYGEKLGKALGPNEGLHGRLENLETPLRDSEGAFARAQMAVIEFGNEGATAADKVGAGFLLVSDSIAAFASGGIVSLAIAAGVASISLLVQAMNEEEEAAKKAEEAQKKHAEELQNLAKSAAAANKTIALVNAETRKKEAIERARAIEQELADTDEKYEALAKKHNEEVERFNNLSALAQTKEESKRLDAQGKEVEDLEKQGKKLLSEYTKTQANIKDAQKDILKEAEHNSRNVITLLVNGLETVNKETTKAIEKETKKQIKAVRKVRDVMAEFAKDEKQRTLDQQALRKEDEKFEKRLEKRQQDARKRFLENQKRNAQEINDYREFKKEMAEADKAEAEAAEKAAAKRLAAFEKSYSLQIKIGDQLVTALFAQAKAGELSAEKLLATVIETTGQELVTKGKGYVLTGLAQLAATAGVQGGPTVAAGSAMIAAGIGMGAVSGSISRSADAPATSSTPTDTRQSRAASTAGSSDGGTTVINFHGDAYDRRGVSNVLNSGLKMARHRRVMGA